MIIPLFPDKQLNDLTRALTDEGKLIEAGWVGLRSECICDDAPEMQLSAMKMAFFAGAQHLFSSIMGVFEKGEDVTENDQRRITNIHIELHKFAELFRQRVNLQGTTRQ